MAQLENLIVGGTIVGIAGDMPVTVVALLDACRIEMRLALTATMWLNTNISKDRWHVNSARLS